MAASDARRVAPTPARLAFLAGVLGHLPALRSFWSQDDWGLLARAAGVQPEGALPARLLSQVVYWRAFFPFFGLDAAPWAVTRLLLHGGSAALLARLAGRCGLTPLASLAAGLLFASAPVALAPVWSANAVQDLLALCLALVATDFFLAARGFGRDGAHVTAPPRARRDLAVAGVLGGLAMLAKESAFGLPLLWGAVLLARRRVGAPGSRAAWGVVAALSVVAAGEAVLVLRHFDRAAGAAYALGGPADALFNLLIYGVWSAWPWPFYPTTFPAAFYAAAVALWAAWGWLATRAWRRGDRVAAAGVGAALLALAPLLPLAHHTIPYLVYPASAGFALAIATLVPRRPASSAVWPVALVAVALAWALGLFSVWVRERGADGLPRDPLLAHTEISRAAARQLRTLPQLPPSADGAAGTTLVLLQVPPSRAAANQADRLAENMVMASRLHTAVGGDYGPRLVLGRDARVTWANRLDAAPADAFVLAERGDRWVPWGDARQAGLQLALSLAARGCDRQAARALLSAARGAGPRLSLLFDPDHLLDDPAAIFARADAFDAYLADTTPGGARLTPAASAALRQIWRELVGVVREDVGAAASRAPAR